MISSRHIPVLIAAAAAVTVPAWLPVAPAARAAATVLHISPAVRELIQILEIVNIPRERRVHNWVGVRGEGSCVHASLVNLLHWQGRHDLAESWRRLYGNGETAEGLSQKLSAAKIPFAETRDGSEAFLEWALRTRRGANVVVQNGAHMVTLAGLDPEFASVLDSNSPQRLRRIPRQDFLKDWKQSGGWAVTPVGTPPPPSPWIVRPVPQKRTTQSRVP